MMNDSRIPDNIPPFEMEWLEMRVPSEILPECVEFITKRVKQYLYDHGIDSDQ